MSDSNIAVFFFFFPGEMEASKGFPEQAEHVNNQVLMMEPFFRKKEMPNARIQSLRLGFPAESYFKVQAGSVMKT